MSQTLDRRVLTIALLAFFIGALGAGLAVWGVMATRIADAEERLTDYEVRVEALESQLAVVSEALEGQTDAALDDSDDSHATDEPPISETDTESDEDGRWFCYMVDFVEQAGTITLTVDYAQLLTGDEAAAAAAAAGEESPPPNDYFILNENPRLREFVVDPDTRVTLTTVVEGTNPAGYEVALGEWYDMVAGMSPGMEVVRDVPYWITVEGGRIVEIEEQYLP